MGMRYLIRRANSTDLNEIRKEIPSLEDELGAADGEYKRAIRVDYSANRSAYYSFHTKKEGDSFVWVCPSIELSAEGEKGLFTLCEKFNAAPPEHLAKHQD